MSRRKNNTFPSLFNVTHTVRNLTRFFSTGGDQKNSGPTGVVFRTIYHTVHWSKGHTETTVSSFDHDTGTVIVLILPRHRNSGVVVKWEGKMRVQIGSMCSPRSFCKIWTNRQHTRSPETRTYVHGSPTLFSRETRDFLIFFVKKIKNDSTTLAVVRDDILGRKTRNPGPWDWRI